MLHYIAPSFLDKVAVHITKNYLDLPGVKVPLILGIHGRKGEGKSYQCELVFERMGIEAVRMSAGELESPDAGDPSRLIRLRYREAAEIIRVRGQMAVLMINDLDAGSGRLDLSTQYTVNTQLVHGTLMNIADNPTNVQLPGSYDDTPLNRVPILVTGNDFSTLYAPLIRDGRMEKFYWQPDRDDRIGIVGGIFREDLSAQQVEQLVATFPDQAIDFFSALRSRLYDEQVCQFIHQIGIEKVSKRLVNSVDRPPEFAKPDFSLPRLVEFGNQMVQEQQRIHSSRLVEEYVPHSTQTHDQGKLGGRNRDYAHSANHREPRPHGHDKPAISPSMAAETDYPGSPTSQPGPLSNGSSNRAVNSPQSYSTQIPTEALKQLHQLLIHGYRIGLEYVNQRRFRTNSWQSYSTVQGGEQVAIETLEACLAEHPHDYIRLVGIDAKARKRVSEVIIQRPH